MGGSNSNDATFPLLVTSGQEAGISAAHNAPAGCGQSKSSGSLGDSEGFGGCGGHARFDASGASLSAVADLSDMWLIRAVRQGLAVQEIGVVLASRRLSAARLTLLGRPFSYRRTLGPFLPEEPNRLARHLRMIACAGGTFGSGAIARRWLRLPTAAQSGRARHHHLTLAWQVCRVPCAGLLDWAHPAAGCVTELPWVDGRSSWASGRPMPLQGACPPRPAARRLRPDAGQTSRRGNGGSS